MKLAYLQILVPFVCLLVNLLVQLASLRLVPRTGLLRSEYFGFISGMLAFFTVQSATISQTGCYPQDPVGICIANFIIYLCLAYMYFNFINLGETARRIRLLSELYYAKDGLTYPEILSRYNAQEILERRILRLVQNGQIVDKDGRYFTGKPFVLIISQTMLWMKWLLLGRKLER